MRLKNLVGRPELNGEKALALTDDGAWRMGRVTQCHRGGEYDIRYDDGDFEPSVGATKINSTEGLRSRRRNRAGGSDVRRKRRRTSSS